MKTWHIHISGLVQGVGFRPHAYKTALPFGIAGQVSNTKDGVHILFNASLSTARSFFEKVVQNAPPHAIIRSAHLGERPYRPLTGFRIVTGEEEGEASLLLTPDYALCEHCREDLTEKHNRRYRYPFTTCLHCGPRFSIIRRLPYERHHTSMARLAMCPVCGSEYADVWNRRHYSQTNSCPRCAIPLHLYDAQGTALSHDPKEILQQAQQALQEGKVLAVKGVGGYLLLCDATNAEAVMTLRRRKMRPSKPLALLYADTGMAKRDARIGPEEETLLKSSAGPILLCALKEVPGTGLCTEAIAPGLDKIGIMLPAAPLLQLIASDLGKPLVATSANISGSPIIYRDEDATARLNHIADYVIAFDRDIVVPQDDSVMQLTGSGISIVLRRSRGLAPNYFPHTFPAVGGSVLAVGGDLKSAFALQYRDLLYVSQFLGNQENLLSQEAFLQTQRHFYQLLGTAPSLLLADKHPGYYTAREAQRQSLDGNVPLLLVQHHEAHFAAVLAENDLLRSHEPVLGAIWDGTGHGDDGQVWGGEFFVFENGEIERLAHFDYFPQLLGDKMSREPRLSALSLLKNIPQSQPLLRRHFTDTEWNYYQQLLKQPAGLLTSSMGRILDGIASLLGICQHNSYEGEAAMKLEAAARQCAEPVEEYYPLPLHQNRIELSLLLQELTDDIRAGKNTGWIARKVFFSLAVCLRRISEHSGIERIAFSGGVFQNALLSDMVREVCSDKLLYRHRQLSPNDECIGFGQLAWYHLHHRQTEQKTAAQKETLCV